MNAGPLQTVSPLQFSSRSAQFLPNPKANSGEVRLECDEDLEGSRQSDDFPRVSVGNTLDEGSDEEIRLRFPAVDGVDTDTWSILLQRISPMKFAILLDWLSEVCADRALTRETFHLAHTLILRFLISTAISNSDLQLLGIAALSLAAKSEEERVPGLMQLSHCCDLAFSSAQIRDMEQKLLSVLQWRLYVTTPISVLLWLTSRWDAFVGTRPGYCFTVWTETAASRLTKACWVLDACLLTMQLARKNAFDVAATVLYLSVCCAAQEDDYSIVRNSASEDASQLALCSALDSLFSSFFQEISGRPMSVVHDEVSFLLPFFSLLTVWSPPVDFDAGADSGERRMWGSRQRHYQFTLQGVAAVIKSA